LFLLFFDFSWSQKPMRDRDFGRCCTLLLYECCSIIASESTQISWETTLGGLLSFLSKKRRRFPVGSLTRKKWRGLYAYPMGKHNFTHLQVNGSCVVAFGVTKKNKKKMWGWVSTHFHTFFVLFWGMFFFIWTNGPTNTWVFFLRGRVNRGNKTKCLAEETKQRVCWYECEGREKQTLGTSFSPYPPDLRIFFCSFNFFFASSFFLVFFLLMANWKKKKKGEATKKQGEEQKILE